MVDENIKTPTDPVTDKAPVQEEPKTNQLVDDTNLAAKRMEDATKAAKEERLASEESYAKMKLGGTAEAGQETKPVDKDVKKLKDAAEFFKGTSLEKDIMKDVKD